MLLLSLLLTNILAKSPPYVRPKDSLVIELTPANYNSYIKAGSKVLCAYYAHWCHYSKKMLPYLDKLSHKVKDLPIKIVTYDCEKKGQEKICDDLKIDGYPTIFPYHGTKKGIEYERGEDVDRLLSFVEEFLKGVEKDEKPDTRGYDYVTNYFKSSTVIANPKGEVVVLDDKNFDGIVKNDPFFIEFYATWCGHCKKLEPTWNELAKSTKDRINIGKIEASVNKRIGSKYNVQGYPTLLFINGDKYEKYNGDRSLDSLKRFAHQMLSKTYISEFREKSLRNTNDMAAIGIIMYSNTIDTKLKTYVEAANDLKFFAPVYTMSVQNANYFLPLFNPKKGASTALNLKSTDNYVMMYYPTANEENKLLFYFSKEISGIDLKQWYEKNRFPFLVEMNSDNSQQLLTEPKVVVLGIGQSTADFEEIATKYKNMVPPHIYKADISRAVQFAYVDREAYQDWFKRNFGIDDGVVILTTEDSIFYKNDPDGDAIKLTTIIPALKYLVKTDEIKDILENEKSPLSWKTIPFKGESFGPSGVFSVIYINIGIIAVCATSLLDICDSPWLTICVDVIRYLLIYK